MSTVSVPVPVSTAATRMVACAGCHTEFAIPADSWVVLPLCPQCRRAQSWAEARKLLADAKALRDGAGVFADLRVDERQEQLAALLGMEPGDLAPSLPRWRDTFIEQLSDAALVKWGKAIQAELSRRFDGAPDPDERQRIEFEDEQYHRELTLHRETDQTPRWNGYERD